VPWEGTKAQDTDCLTSEGSNIMLTTSAIKVQHEEIKRVHSGVKTESWKRTLDDYILSYNEWKQQKALSREIQEIIEEPSVRHSKPAYKASGPKRGHTPVGARPYKVPKRDAVDLTKGVTDNEFVQTGEAWLITYRGGKRLVLKERKGLTYIAHLLSRPKERIHCDLLLALDESVKSKGNEEDDTTSDGAIGEDYSGEWSENDNIHVQDRDQEIELVDKTAALSYQKRIKQIDKLLSVGSVAESRRSKLEAERVTLRGLLGKVGKRRGIISDNDKKKMNQVSKAISDSIESIAKAEQEEQVPPSKSLAAHLRSSLKKGMYISYLPKTDIDWRVETKGRC
jgi:hypothetical protein